MQTVEGMTIYLGVMPAELVQGHSTMPGDPKALHGGTPPNRSSHHIVVALFDAQTGARITDAQIQAGVGNRSDDHPPDTVLAPMEINGAMAITIAGCTAWNQLEGKLQPKISLRVKRSANKFKLDPPCS